MIVFSWGTISGYHLVDNLNHASVAPNVKLVNLLLFTRVAIYILNYIANYQYIVLLLPSVSIINLLKQFKM